MAAEVSHKHRMRANHTDAFAMDTMDWCVMAHDFVYYQNNASFNAIIFKTSPKDICTDFRERKREGERERERERSM